MIDEGYVKFESDWQRAAPLADRDVEELIRWRRPLHAAGLIGHYDDVGVGFGNLSRRSSDDGLFIISGTQTGHLADSGPEHFALVTAVDIARNRVSSRGPIEASSESMTHAVLYDVDERIGGVVHVHSPRLWESLMDRLPTTDPQVPYGTPEMAEEIRRLYRRSDFAATGVAVMAGHEAGLISVGETVAEASTRILALAAA
jgi:ribulose-5-phosphate 4-epimerase/fuculose-1-phosphate aldolase